MTALTPNDVVQRFKRAKDRRSTWESHWQECYDYALPQRGDVIRALTPGAKRTDKLFDGTAPDAVDQLAASLLAQMTPPWTRWFGFRPGTDYGESDRDAASAALEAVAATLQRHLDRSNFVVEMHQCYLDLVTAGTACLLVEEAQVGEPSAFRFAAVPLSQVVLEEGPSGRLDTTYRRSEMTRAQIQARFKEAVLPADALPPPIGGEDEDERKAAVIEAVMPDKGGYAYMAVLETSAAAADEPVVLAKGRFASPPYINFRWLKAPGEIYGRSPVMKALPDIKTANKVVELVLKNATIAVTGIWQADDDGVLNPATVKLTPGTIIPKAVGSAGLQPLSAPGKFDVSELVLEKLQERIERIIKGPSLPPVAGGVRSATETLERRADQQAVELPSLRRLFGELYFPVVRRGLYVLTDPRLAGTDLHVEPFETVGGFGGEDAKPDRMATVDALMGAVLSPADMMQQNVQAQKALSAAIALGQIYGGMQNVPEIDHPAFRRTFLEQSGLESDLLTDPDAEPETGAQAAQAAEALSALAGGGAGGGQPAATDPLAGLLSGAGVAGHG